MASPRPFLPAAAWVLLALTAAASLIWSHAKLLSQDEIFVLQTDGVSTLRQLIHVQRTSPISLDPLVYHLVGYASLHLLHANTPAAQAFALRLPSLFGFLLMQCCVFVFVRRFCAVPRGVGVAERAGLVALAIPPITATLFYSAEARPYGLLLGFCGLILVSWQAAAVELDPPLPKARQSALALLLLALSLALNTHYFAVLLLLPLGAAELHRTLARRRFDWPMLATLAAGGLSFVATLPFQKAAGAFRLHYYNANSVNGHAISQAYRALLIDYTAFPMTSQRAIAAVLLIGAFVFVTTLLRLLWTRPSTRTPEFTLLLSLAALPLAGFLLGRFATHSFEVRYVLCTLPALSALLAILLAPALQKRVLYRVLLGAATVAFVLATVLRVESERHREQAYLASLQLPPTLWQTLAGLSDRRIYVQDVGQLEPASVYLRDTPAGSPLTLLYSREQELRWDHHDTASLTAEHLARFTNLPVASWSELTARPGPHLLILFHSGWNWTDEALQNSGAQVRPLGPALGGDAVLVDWPAPARITTASLR